MLDRIIVKGAREHNLKNVDVEIPKNKLVVFTGLSGSGKSSLAFDTIYAEGQRRYVESLSAYARQFLGIMKKPDVDKIEGLSPAISIDQKSTSHNPRSTVGTITEIYDYLRLLFARIGKPHCPNCGRPITRMSTDQIYNEFVKLTTHIPKGGLRFLILAPLVKDRKGEYKDLFESLKKKGYTRVRVDRQIFSLSEEFVLLKTNKHSIDAIIDRLVITKNFDSTRVGQSIEQSLNLSGGEVIIAKVLDSSFDFPEKPKKMEDKLFSQKLACTYDGASIPQLEPRSFSFNSPHGACQVCGGLGTILTVDPELIINPRLTILEGGVLPFSRLFSHDTWFSRLVKVVCQEHGISLTTPLGNLPKEKLTMFLYGTGDREYEVEGTNRHGRITTIYEVFEGFAHELERRHKESDSEFIRTEIEKFMRYEVCKTCNGARLRKEALSVTIDDKTIVEISSLSIAHARSFVEKLTSMLSGTEKTIALGILKELKARLSFLISVGLDYLTIDRPANSLAGGEAQRIRLASQIGSGLSGVLYVLDEPSIGLHQRDNKKLIDTLAALRDLGNTVIVVEHDREMMEHADYIFDFGPGAGEGGGEIVAKGTLDDIKHDKNSLTGQFLSGIRKINVRPKSVIPGEAPNRTVRGEAEESHTRTSDERDPSTRRFTPSVGMTERNHDFLTIRGAAQHNLKNIDVLFPLGKLICVTGLSGSGKSTLVHDILYHAVMSEFNPYHRERPGKFSAIEGLEHINRAILIDQSPIGRTPRSNPATYTGAFTFIRDLFTTTKEARNRGYKMGRFSFNVSSGRCEACQGEGEIKIEMQFLPDVYITCEVCQGSRYNQETLEITYRGKNIAEVLAMSVEEAHSFFEHIPALSHKLTTLVRVGLSYIKLGQSAVTLSGGEAQRVKIATELSKRQSGRTLYLLDEPTTGLHFADLEKLLNVLRALVTLGNTVIVIEHNLDVIANSDYIIDLGPEGGDLGGEVIATGTPREVTKVKKSYTGKFLNEMLP